MKKLLLLLVLLPVCYGISAQERWSSTLESHIENDTYTWRKIFVVGTNRVDGYQYAADHLSEYVNRTEFAIAFLQELREQKKSEDIWIADLVSNELDFEIIHQFWSVNIVAINASPEAIQFLNNHPEVYWMEELDERKVELHHPVEGYFPESESVGGKEQGICSG